MSLCLLCPAVPEDRCGPATADRTAQMESARQKHVSNETSVCFKYSSGTCSALETFLQGILALKKGNVIAIDRAVAFAKCRNVVCNVVNSGSNK